MMSYPGGTEEMSAIYCRISKQRRRERWKARLLNAGGAFLFFALLGLAEWVVIS